ncbi:MAG: twin-arginine translocation signal domain-containing protein, partial [Candidatus Saccharimonas sp.]|nr:twin-arginine translocation signal domain-containing protein [Planctomycetaceae bacterium]
MTPIPELLAEHFEVTRRHFLRLGTIGAAGLSFAPWLAHADDATAKEALDRAVAQLEYFTALD